MAMTPAEELEGWAASVLRLLDESQESAASRPDYWGPFDLVGAYHQRGRLGPATGESPGAVLKAVDALLRSFTEDVGSSWVEAIGLGDEVGTGWWWRLVPREGPLRAELRERVARRTQ